MMKCEFKTKLPRMHASVVSWHAKKIPSCEMSLPRAGITLFLPFKTTSPWTSETCSSAIGSSKYSVYNNQSHLTSYNTLLTMPLMERLDEFSENLTFLQASESLRDSSWTRNPHANIMVSWSQSSPLAHSLSQLTTHPGVLDIRERNGISLAG